MRRGLALALAGLAAFACATERPQPRPDELAKAGAASSGASVAGAPGSASRDAAAPDGEAASGEGERAAGATEGSAAGRLRDPDPFAEVNRLAEPYFPIPFASPEHGVGFEARVVLDPARTYAATFADGSVYSDEPAPRPVLVLRWYPAEPGGPSMPWGEYFELAEACEGDPRRERFAAALSAYAREKALEYLTYDTPAHGDPELARELLEWPTLSVRGAPLAGGRYPLVLRHAGYGSSYEDDFALCETLASMGFVVLSSAFQEADGSSFNIDGGEGSFADLELLLRLAEDMPDADASRVGIVGHSGGAHVALHFAALPESPVDAVVALDTTQDFWSAEHPRWTHPQALLAAGERFTTPVLAATNPAAWFDLLDRMTGSERVYATFPELEHDEFIAQGVLRAAIAEASGGSVREEGSPIDTRDIMWSYGSLVLDVQAFLREHLAGGDPLAWSVRRPSGNFGRSRWVEFVPPGAAGPGPWDPESGAEPTPRQLRAVFDEVGAPAVAELLARVRAQDEAWLAQHPQTLRSPLLDDMFALPLLYDLVDQERLDDARAIAGAYPERRQAFARFFRWFVERYEEPRYDRLREVSARAAEVCAE